MVILAGNRWVLFSSSGELSPVRSCHINTTINCISGFLVFNRKYFSSYERTTLVFSAFCRTGIRRVVRMYVPSVFVAKLTSYPVGVICRSLTIQPALFTCQIMNKRLQTKTKPTWVQESSNWLYSCCRNYDTGLKFIKKITVHLSSHSHL